MAVPISVLLNFKPYAMSLYRSAIIFFFIIIRNVTLSAQLDMYNPLLFSPETTQPKAVTYLEKTYNLSGENIRFLIRNPEDASGIVYFNLHDNENTCVVATDCILNHFRGKFIELKFKGDRWIGGFMNPSYHFWFDPNRIYSDFGIFKTLKSYRSFTAENKKKVRIFSEYVTDSLLKGAEIIIAVHNNQKGYSVEQYLPDSIFEKSAAQIHYNKERSPHDFYFVNEYAHFRYFKHLGYNVILQSKDPEDDGSLSVYCARKKIPYINIEALEGHFEEQYEMLLELQLFLMQRK